jgi:hypothetical protein
VTDVFTSTESEDLKRAILAASIIFWLPPSLIDPEIFPPFCARAHNDVLANTSSVKSFFMTILFVLFQWLLECLADKEAVTYFDNYFTNVGTLFCIVQCFVVEGKIKG